MQLPRNILTGLLTLSGVLSPLSTFAQLGPLAQLDPFVSPTPPDTATPRVGAIEALQEQFGHGTNYIDMAIVLGFALALAAVIAHHPSLRRKASTVTQLEQPKTLVMYGLVGALVGHVVTRDPNMAMVIFGIGGLMRFRTDVGEAKDTGRVILVAIVGICCGVQSFLIAALATAIGFALVWYLERQLVGSVDILRVEPQHVAASAAAYRKLLEQSNCTVLGESKSANPKKPALSLVFLAPSGVDKQQIESQAAQLEANIRGHCDWHIS